MEPDAKPKSLSCIPCAKRKVRCDRLQPCSHCRRRKNDVCEYPLQNGSAEKVEPSEALIKMQQERIEKLEQLILHGGGDLGSLQPSHVAAVLESVDSSASGAAPSVSQPNPPQGTKRSHDGTLRPINMTPSGLPYACLVEHNKQTTYIETPMWYSWGETKAPEDESQESQQKTSTGLRHLQNDFSAGYVPTVLESPGAQSSIALDRSHPSPKLIHELWNTFLTNVHPSVKLFFDWDKAPMFQKAANDPASLSREEQALVFAVYFMAILSLSDEECKAMFNGSRKIALLNDYQALIEAALMTTNYASTSDLRVLQAFILYVLAMRNRAKPATLSSMLGIGVRVAQRLGLHRDGSFLDLAPMQIEERRRVWWWMQHMEILISILIGCLSVTLYAEWDTKMPANLDDEDISPNMKVLPPERDGLTSMSDCLWRYHILYMHRERKKSGQGNEWITFPHISITVKDSLMEKYKKRLAENFLQHCEIMNPYHVHIQIGIQSFLLAMQRSCRQPVIARTRISEMSKSDRDDCLKICVKCMECYIFAMTTQSLAHFRWTYENYFQWTAFVHILVEAHHRAATNEAPALWKLIDKVCELHPKLTSARESSDVSAIGRLIVYTWQRRQEQLEQQLEHIEKPWCVCELERALSVDTAAPDANGQNLALGQDDFGLSFDFDLIDWSFWETAALPLGR